MIHVATVHWHDATWIPIQLDYLRRHLSEPFRVYAFLNGLPDTPDDDFHYVCREEIRDHATKLNLLADVIGFAADSDDDLVLFIDGDAFPIADPVPLAKAELPSHKLIAVQRAENNGDRQPHPCFCITTVGFWREIRGDWKKGHTWRNAQGAEVTDVGGNLLGLLERAGVDWLPLLKTRSVDPHPLNFAVYGDLVYHHGGGFRPTKGGRVNRILHGEEELARSTKAKLLDALPDRGWFRKLREKHHPVLLLRERLRIETAAQSRRVFERLVADPEFHRTGTEES